MTMIEKMKVGAERLASYSQGFADGASAVTAALSDHVDVAYEGATVEAEQRRPEWADVAQFADITAERDRARDTAVRLEQELAEREREIEHIAKGALLAVLAESNLAPDRSATWCAQQAAEKLGVTL